MSEVTDVGEGFQRSITEAVTGRIRREILSGRIRPGERIRLRPLAELLGVSHIPIREALQRLEGEGLVENVPQRGAIATPLSLTELAEVYELRKILEPIVAARAVPMEPARLAQVEQALEAMNGIPEEWLAPSFPELHRRFHWLLLEPGANRVIEQTIRQLWQTSERYVRFAMTVGSGAPIAARHHRRLLTAAKRGDGAMLASELVSHLEYTEAGVRNSIELDGPANEELGGRPHISNTGK